VLMGLRNALAGLTASAVALLAGGFVERDAFGNGYAATFLLAFALTSVGLALLMFVREPASIQVRDPARVRDRLQQLPALLRADRTFTRYFAARALATMGRMGVPLYALYARDTIGLDGTQIGRVSAAFIFAQSLGPLLGGVLADRRGFRFVFLLALSLWMFAVLMLMNAASATELVVVFAALGAGLGGFQMSSQNLVLEFGSSRNLPMRIAVANSASDLVAAIGAIGGGLLTFVVGFSTIFWVALAFQAVALAAVLFFVDEPRHRRARSAGGQP